MRLRVEQRLFLSYCLLISLLVAGATLVTHTTFRRQLTASTERDLRREVAVGRALYESASARAADSVADLLGSLTAHRVTLIAPSGAVIGDSEFEPPALGRLENHADRPEIREARSTGFGMSIRVSPSVGTRQMYVAAPAAGGEIIRFAAPLHQLDEYVGRVQRGIILGGLGAVVLAGLFSLSHSFAVGRPLRSLSHIARAMAAGDLNQRLKPGCVDELGDLTRALNALANELHRRLGQLEGERAEMQALIDGMAEGVVAIDGAGRVRRTNPAARDLFGLRQPAELHPEAVSRRPEFLRLVREALDGTTVAPTELTSDGRHLLATAQPLPHGGAVLVFLDISRLRRLESVRRDFVANASHELKTPLTAIRGYTETLLDDDLPPELRRQFAEVIRANADRLQRLVDDLLDLSRIESGGWRANPEQVRIDEVASEAWAGVSPESEKTLHFSIAPDAASEFAYADPSALRQIFSNLFSNAVRHTAPGGTVSVDVRAVNEPDPPVAHAPPPGTGRCSPSPRPSGSDHENWVEIAVSDTGSGIPAAHLPRIFERFYRADPARSRAAGGTGLGLAIVRHLVEAHGGRVTAESALSGGTTISFTLPAPPDAHPE